MPFPHEADGTKPFLQAGPFQPTLKSFPQYMQGRAHLGLVPAVCRAQTSVLGGTTVCAFPPRQSMWHVRGAQNTSLILQVYLLRFSTRHPR